MEIIFFEIEPPRSFDPLEADRAINLQAVRMMYLTPIEFSVNNTLVSTVLDDFEYSTQTQTIHWTIRPGLLFEDGSPITVDDVLLSVLRMALVRPDFPVIRNIQGLKDWLQLKSPLKTHPSGIEVHENKVKIKLTEPTKNPLFRFCLELFSIIPRKCVDLTTNKLICERPPESGYYRLRSKDKGEYQFEQRLKPLAHKISPPTAINFRFLTAAQLKENPKQVSDSSILMGVDFSLFSNELSHLKQEFNFKYLPESLFAAIMLNPTIPPFDDIKCRQTFSAAFQYTIKKEFNTNLVFSKSIFVPIIPGYLKDAELPQHQIDETCINKFVKHPIVWAKITSKRASYFEQILAKSMTNFNIPNRVVEVENMAKAEMLFVKNEIALRSFGSGFWALDPLGDIQMLFTPNLHPMLKYIANDKVIVDLLEKLRFVNTPDKESALLKQVNLHLYNDAKMNVFLHTRKFYVSPNKNILRDLAQGVASPAAWQVFAD